MGSGRMKLGCFAEEKNQWHRVTLDIFSGRPNPSWLLPERDEQQLVKRLKALNEPTVGPRVSRFLYNARYRWSAGSGFDAHSCWELFGTEKGEE